MADDFQSGICSGSWWNTQRSGAATGFDASVVASASCSTAITDAGSGAGSLSWSTAAESLSVNSQMASGPLTDSSLQISGYGLSPSTMDWNQPLLRSGGGAEPSFHALLQEAPPFNYFRPDPSIEPDQVVQAGTGDSSSSNLYKDISQTNFLLDQQHRHHHHQQQQQQQQLSSGNESGANYGMTGFPAATYGCPSTVLQGLFESDNKSQQSFYQPQMIGYSSNDPMAKFSQFLKSGSSPPKQQSSTNHLNFANNAPFWNPSVPSLPVQFGAHSFEQKPSCSNLTTKSNPEGVRDSCSSATKKSSSEPALKKPRIETPSPLPTFKVRKEKLGDRITALQQLVSPFGKTDTASVLHEAIEYIKFLHEQVSVLSTPYLKNGHPMQHHQSSDKSKDGEGPKQDLRSRGLCLVPVASTYPVASETNADFWTPTFGGTYR